MLSAFRTSSPAVWVELFLPLPLLDLQLAVSSLFMFAVLLPSYPASQSASYSAQSWEDEVSN